MTVKIYCPSCPDKIKDECFAREESEGKLSKCLCDKMDRYNELKVLCGVEHQQEM